MRIKTRIKLGIILSLVLAATIALLLFLGTRAANETSRLDGIAGEVIKGVAEIKIVTHEYILHPEERSLMQWRSRYGSLSKLLTGGHFKNPDEKIAADQIFKNLERFKTVFSALITGLRKGEAPGNQESAAFRELQDRLMDELLMKSRLVVSLAFQFQQEIEAKLVTTQERVTFLTLLLLLTLTAAIIGISLWINSSVARPIAKLEKGTQIIGRGNLDHEVGTTAKDEIGELSRAFDKMTQDLKKTTTSIVELNKEVDERKQAEEALRESEERYRTLVHNLPVAVYRNTPGPKGTFLMANPAFCNMFGFKNEEEVKKVAPADLYVNPKERQQYSDNLIQEGVLKDFERTLSKKDGTPVHTSITSRVVYAKDGKVSHFDSIMLDISEQKLAEEALRESEERHRELVENAVLGVFQVTKGGKFLMANQRMANIFGYDSQQDFFANVDNIIELYVNPEERSKVLQEIDESGHINGKEMNFKRTDGTPIFCNAYARSIQSKEGEYFYEGLLEDITDKKKMEAQLQQINKMEAIAILAGGVAHEFNNALMGILGNIELLKMDLPEDDRRDRYFEAMKDSGHRMSRLTDQLLAYAQGGKYQPKNLKLDDFMIQTLPILQHDLSPTVRVETHFQKDIAYTKADYAQMQMVLSAILANSNEAIEEEGLIKITAENEVVDEDFTKQHPGLKPGYYVCLTIEDNGKGMDEETRNGIFEPFFTTKFQGRGMAMAAVYGIVMNHDGWIYVDSELGKGTTVRIYLPAIEIEVEKPKKAKIEVVRGSGTILMIEDEDVVIEVTQAMLEWLGYRVMVAKTGKNAIHITETFDGQIDLALLDIKLPDMEGGKLYPLIMKARPDLKVIVFSGYAIDGPARKILDAGAQDFIQKPFSLATLSEKLKEVLEGK